MIETATGVAKGGLNVFPLEIREVSEDLVRALAGGEHVQDVDHPDAQSPDARAASALLGVAASYTVLTPYTHPNSRPCYNPSVGLFFLMATVLTKDGFRVRIYGPPREHPPPHVHVEKGREGLVILRLPLPGKPLAVWRVYKMSNKDVLKAYRLVEDHQDAIGQAWRAIHG
jgi:hypothetical protein